MINLTSLLWNNLCARIGLIIISVFFLAALFAPLLSQYAPDKRTGNPHEYPSFIVKSAQANPNSWVTKYLADDRRTLLLSKKAEHVLGTSRMGRDIWAQVLHGARISLSVGFGAGMTVCILATIIGISSGYFGGRVDDCLSVLMNIMLVIPQYPLLFVIAAFIGEAGPLTIAIMIGCTSWAWGARVIRSQTLALRRKEFIRAAEVIGEHPARIIFIEIFPNLIPIVGASFIGSVMYAIGMESIISFLGLGDPNTISWGIMLYNVQTTSSMLIGAWWEVLVPCLALSILITGLALLNFAVDEIANPQLRSSKRLRKKRKQKELPQETELKKCSEIELDVSFTNKT